MSRRRVGVALWLGIAIAATGACSSGGGGGTLAAKTSPLSLLAPAGLASEPGPFEITLTWSQAAGSAKVKGYRVYRDGSLLGTVDFPRTNYVDTAVSPGKSYAYEVVAVDARDAESDRTSLTVETPTPSMSDARVHGRYDVRAHEVSRYGYASGGGDYTVGWRLTAKCDSGACDVVWTDMNGLGIKATLRRKGGQYTGTARGRFDSRCGKSLTTSALTVRLRVVKATGLAGEWRASRLRGTLIQREAAQLGCVASGADFTIRATLIP